MIIAPTPLGAGTLPRETLEADRAACARFGPCGVGAEALYIGSRYLERRRYIPWREVTRVFKRVAMSSGGFTGKGIFGSMAYLVVQFGGQERQCRFRREEDVDRLLEQVERQHPRVPTHSAAAERKLAEAEAAEQARWLKELTPAASDALQTLRRAQDYLANSTEVPEALVFAAKEKRIADGISPAHRAVGAAMALVGAAAAAYGIYALLIRATYALYFIIGGAALLLMALTSGTLPSRRRSKRALQSEWEAAVEDSRRYISAMTDFPVPPQYAHPIVLERMERVLREGRAQTAAEALAAMKSDLRALNSEVKVSQKEHDEVVKIKPLFLVCDYRDEL